MRRVRLPHLQRSAADRLLFGVCAGIAHGAGANVLLVRLACTALLVVSGGIGVIAYAALVLLLPAEPAPVVPWTARSLATLALLVAFGAVLYAFGLHVVTPPLSVLVPAALLTAGVALVWREMTRARDAATRLDRGELVRLGAGLALLVGGAVSFLTDSDKLAGLSSALIAAAVVAAGLGLIVGPQLAQARAEAEAERRRRIRADERADFAAQLHDSVLQTLALVQSADDLRRAQSLARSQERELRGWLYQGEGPGEATTLASALRTAAAEVEENYRIEIDLVQPSDGVLDEAMAALAAAAREAMANAGRHAGVEEISVLARVTDDEATVYVRDAGRGFDPAHVGADRRGVRESIVGRMERSGGRAIVHSTPGEGTEVELVLPRRGS